MNLVSDIAALAGICVFLVVMAAAVILMWFPARTTALHIPPMSEAPTVSWHIRGRAPVAPQRAGSHRLVVTR